MSSAAFERQAPPHASASRLWPATGEFAAIVAIGVLTHVLALAAVYPGYYSPLWPNHSDYYIASEMAHTPGALEGLWQVFRGPRPLGFIYFYLTGLLGTRGAILVNLFVIAINCALTAMFIRRLAGFSKSYAYYIAAFLYYFLVFTHPLQYIWSTYDIFSQLSYLFIISALLAGLRGAPIPALALGAVAAMLSKETHALSLLFFLAAWGVSRRDEARKPALRLMAATVVGVGIAIAYNKTFGSTFLGSGATAGSAYEVVLAPASVIKEWLLYARQGASPAIWGYLAVVVLVVAANRRETAPNGVIAPLAFSLAGLLAWAPNAVLPNHHMAGYAWNGAYWIFAAPLLLTPLASGALPRRALFFGLTALCLLTPLSLKAAYKENQWVVDQQRRQRLVMMAVDQKARGLSPGVKDVLVTGLNFPFSPFDHPNSIHEYADRLPVFHVVAYQPRPETDAPSTAPVRYVSPEAAIRRSFDEVWAFGDDGALKDLKLSKDDAATLTAVGIPPAALAVYPAVGVAFDLDKAGKANFDGYHMLNCGGALLNYKQYELALKCLSVSEQMVPENAYSYFYAGLSYENLGKPALAEAQFAKAVAYDDKAHPNPAFKEALERVKALSAPATR